MYKKQHNFPGSPHNVFQTQDANSFVIISANNESNENCMESAEYTVPENVEEKKVNLLI